MKKDDFNRLVEEARNKNVLEYFRESGYRIEKKGKQHYVTDIPGLVINENNNQWYYHYENVGRTNNTLDCLTRVVGIDFNQAVYELTGKDITNFKAEKIEGVKPKYTSPPTKVVTPDSKIEKELEMPKQAGNCRRIFAYFCQTRKIPAKIVEELVHAKLLYQSDNNVKATINGEEKTFRNSNAVFVHKNEKNEIVGAEIQGCNSYKRYKGVATGTKESAFIFTPYPASNGTFKKAYIFESAIDMMSFYSFCKKEKIQETAFISLAGLKPTVPKKLQEQGVQIFSCVDNDDAGRRFENDNGFTRPDFVKALLDDKGFKDWNEMLVFQTEHPNSTFDKNLYPRAEQNLSNTETMTRRR